MRHAPCLDPPPLPGAASVVRLRGDVADARDLEAGGLEGADGGLPAGAGPLDEDLDLLQAVLDALARRGVGGDLGGEGRGLARAAEAGAARGLPGDDVPLAVGQRDDRVVEQRLDEGLADGDVLADAPATALRATRSGHLLLGGLLPPRHLHALGPLARARVGLGVLSPHGQAAPVAHAAVGADLLQALDALGALAAQIALDREVLVDALAQAGDLVLGEVPDVGVRGDLRLVEDLAGGRGADPVDVGQADLYALVEGDVDPGDACHEFPTPAAACVVGSSR